MITLLLFVFFGALSQVAANHAIRAIQARSQNAFVAVLGNNVAALVLAGGYWVARGVPAEGWATAVGFGTLTGFFYTAALVAIIRNMGQRGMAMTGALASASQIVPVLLAIALGETLSHLQTIGVVAAAIALPLLSLATVDGACVNERPRLSLAALLFVLQGGAMSGNLIAVRHVAHGAMPLYLTMVFLSSAVFSVCLLAWDGGKTRNMTDFRRGAVFGAINIASTVIIVTALSRVPGAIFFATMGTLGLLVTVLLGIWLWRERLQLWGWAGLCLTAIATPLMVLK